MLARGPACLGYFKAGQCCTVSDKVWQQPQHSKFTQCNAYYSCSCMTSTCLCHVKLSGAGTLRQLYRNAMQMEVDFFSAQPGVSSTPSVGMLVIDFDETCTATDTTSQVFNTAIAASIEAAQGTAVPERSTYILHSTALGSEVACKTLQWPCILCTVYESCY